MATPVAGAVVDSSGVYLGIEGLTAPELIGTGGFAVVYRAQQPAFRRTVAVKVLTVGKLDESTRSRFERECQVMGSLSEHPSIVTVFDAGFTAEGRPYLLMAYMPGGSLEDRIAAGGAMPWQEAVPIAVRMAGALEVAHRGDVIHRDIKPDNILLSSFGEPQLSDFGIARIAGGPETRSGVITASLAHAAPEIMEGDRPTVASDVYSLGSTLFHLLAGAPAFVRHTDESVFPLMRRIKEDPVPDLRARGVPPEVCEVVESAMQKDPPARPPTALELGRRLQEAQRLSGSSPTSMLLGFEAAPPSEALHPAAGSRDGGDTVQVTGPPTEPPAAATSPTAPTPAGPVPEGERVPERSGRRRWPLLLVGVLAVTAVVAGALWLALRGGDSVDPVADQGVLQPGGEVDGFLEAEQVHIYTFEGREGIVAGVEMRGSADPFVRVFGPDGALVAADDDMGGGADLDALALFVMPASGTYRVEASDIGEGEGDYVVALNFGAAPLLGRPAVVEERLEFSPTDRDLYVFTAAAGEVILVRMMSDQPGLDPQLAVYGPAEELATDDDSGGGIDGLDAAVEFTAPADGTYRVVAGHSDSTGGSYRLEISG